MLPLVPVRVRVYVPWLVFLFVAIVSIELAGEGGRVSDAGLNVHVLSGGQPVTLRLTVPAKPFSDLSVAVYLALEPCLMLWLVGEAEMEKSGDEATTVSVTVLFCWMPPPLPVTVMG